MVYELHQAQKKIALSKARFRVVNAGRRFGKTLLVCLEMASKAFAQNDRKIAYVSTTFQQSRDIAWRDLKRICLPILINVNESRLEIEVKTQDGGTSFIWLRGWESVETLRGQRFDMIVLDEVANMRNFWVGWHEVLRPTLTDTKGEALFISTPKGFNHFYDLFNSQYKDDEFESFHFTSYDNPFIPSEELDKARGEMSEDRFAQEYLADFRKQQGLVYKEFDRSKLIYDEDELNAVELSMLIEPKIYLAGVDFGYTNPAAVLSIKIDSMDNWWIVDEWYKTGRTETQIAEYVSAKGYEYVYPDPESPSAIKELENRGVNVREVIKGKDSISNGISKVRELLKAGKLKINKNCINTISEFETYAYPDSKDDIRNEDERPIEGSDHAMDALRYAVMMTNRNNHRTTVFKPHQNYQRPISGRRNKTFVFKPGI